MGCTLRSRRAGPVLPTQGRFCPQWKHSRGHSRGRGALFGLVANRGAGKTDPGSNVSKVSVFSNRWEKERKGIAFSEVKFTGNSNFSVCKVSSAETQHARPFTHRLRLLPGQWQSRAVPTETAWLALRPETLMAWDLALHRKGWLSLVLDTRQMGYHSFPRGTWWALA